VRRCLQVEGSGDWAMMSYWRTAHDPSRVQDRVRLASRWKALLDRGVRVGKDQVQRLMKLHGIRARGKSKFVVTTDTWHARLVPTSGSSALMQPAASASSSTRSA